MIGQSPWAASLPPLSRAGKINALVLGGLADNRDEAAAMLIDMGEDDDA